MLLSTRTVLATGLSAAVLSELLAAVLIAAGLVMRPLPGHLAAASHAFLAPPGRKIPAVRDWAAGLYGLPAIDGFAAAHDVEVLEEDGVSAIDGW